jgi:hypothetical protein
MQSRGLVIGKMRKDAPPARHRKFYFKGWATRPWGNRNSLLPEPESPVYESNPKVVSQELDLKSRYDVSLIARGRSHRSRQ